MRSAWPERWAFVLGAMLVSSATGCLLTLDAPLLSDGGAPGTRDVVTRDGALIIDAAMPDVVGAPDAVLDAPPEPDVPVLDVVPDDANRLDASTVDVVALRCSTSSDCATGFECCPSTGGCYDRRCLSCCMPELGDGSVVTDDAGALDSSMGDVDGGAHDAASTPDVVASDARWPEASTTDVVATRSCSPAGTCAPGEACCMMTNTCYDTRCLSCCMAF